MPTFFCRACKSDVEYEEGKKANSASSYHRYHFHCGNKLIPTIESGSVQAEILAGVEQIKNALLKIDDERNQLQQKLLALDDLAAKYKKLI